MRSVDPGSGRTLAACLIHASRTPSFLLSAWLKKKITRGYLPISGDNIGNGC